MASKALPEEFQILKPFVDKAAAYSMEARYSSVEALELDLRQAVPCGNQKNHPTTIRHLLTEIAVAGTQRRIGTTHLAVSLTCFLNQNYRPCIYQEYYPSDCMRLLIKEGCGYIRNDGLISYEKFLGIPYYGEGIERQEQMNGLYVQDYGIHIQEIAEEEKPFVLVMGSRPWEIEQTKRLLEKISRRSNLVLICNYGNSIKAKQLARIYHHRVYCFPLDSDPFRMTGEKRKLFQKLLRQEGW